MDDLTQRFATTTVCTEHYDMMQLVDVLNDEKIKSFVYARGHLAHARETGGKRRSWQELERVSSALYRAATEYRPVIALTQRRVNGTDSTWDYIATKLMF